MSDSEVMHNPESKVPKDNNEEFDIYSDVLSDQDSLVSKLKEKVDKLSKEKELLLKSLTSVQKNYDELRKEYEDLKEKFKVLSFNSSALFKTAQAEIKRKDRLIYEIRKEKDDLVFRKTSVNQALQRSRRFATLSPRKYKSPIKKNRLNNPNSESSRPKKDLIEESENSSSIKEPLGEIVSAISIKEAEILKNPLIKKEPSVEPGDTKPLEASSEELNNSKPPGKLSKENRNSKVSNIQPDEENVENKLLGDKNCSDKEVNISSKTKPVPPPFTGPSTAYSRRLYKRLHGISPPKADSKFVKKDIVPKHTELQLNFKSSETKTTKIDHKEETVTSKLQKEVQEIIKLGTPSSKISPTSVTKLSPGKQKSHSALVKDETPQKIPSKPLAEKIIIQCDLRNTPKDRQKISQNSISINETIDSILKKQRAGYYSLQTNIANDMKGEEPKKDNSCSDPLSKTASKIFSNQNKRATDKLTISPATFGKLVSNPAKCRPNVTPPSKEKLEKSPTESKSESRKRKVSDSVSPGNGTSPQQNQRTKRDTHPKSIKKTKFISSLFGDSPMKPDENKNETESSKSANPTNIRIPSPIENAPGSSSPIFPDSPSLDSDNQEDLIIDTTACSQNTSPRVSECENKDVDEIIGKAEVKTSGVIDKSKEQLLSEDIGKKESATDVENLVECSNFDVKSTSTSPETTNVDQNKLLIANNSTDNQKEEENVISLTQAAITCGERVTEEEMSNCPSGSNKEQNKSEEDNFKNLHLENSHSSGSLDKVLTPEKSSESQSLPLADGSYSRKEETAVVRFIPSPPQLTLVSAFKHSENSVFALAEDTLGFVSALTRMRDISPIRTPVKKNHLSNMPLSQSQQSELESFSKVGMLNSSSFEFVKPLNQLKSPKQSNHNNPLSVEPAPSSNSKQSEKKEYKKDTVCKTNTAENNQHIDVQSQKSRYLDQEIVREQSFETPKIVKPSHENKCLNSSKNVLSPKIQQNPFLRKKPVRRITTENKSELPSNTQSTKNLTKPKDSSRAQEDPERETLKKIIPPNKSDKEDELNKLENKPNVEKPNVDKTLAEVKALGQVKNVPNTSIGGKDISNRDNGCQAKNVSSQPLVFTNNDKVKSFKRSESLKMAQKPLPRNYLNVIKNTESEKSKEVPETLMDKTRSSEEFAPKGGNCGDKLDNVKSAKKSSEVEQISHIASINKKLRVSKYQSKPDKENLIQSKQSETLIPCAKNSIISHDKTLNQTTMVSDNFKGKPEKFKEKIKPYPTSLNVSSRAKRRNDRRSVSLGPEIRLGIHINLPPVRNVKPQKITSINDSKDSISIVPAKKGEYILTKSSSKQISEITSKKSDEGLRIERMNKEKVFESGSKTSTSDKLNPKTKVDGQSELRSPSPKRHKTDHNCHERSKSPEVEEKNERRLRRSMSQSPDRYKRSRSSHKASFGKTPDSERRNRHILRNSHSRSPERKRSNNRYSPRRSDSGGRSRRSRYESHRRRSPSPDQRRHKYYEKKQRSRSSYYKRRDRSARSRSRSPELKHRRYEERPRHRSRNWRRSRSNSSQSHDRTSRSCSPHRQKADSRVTKNINNVENSSFSKSTNSKLDEQPQDTQDTILSYKEELEKIKKELDMIKGQFNNSEGSKVNSPVNSNEHRLQNTSENAQSSELLVNKSVELGKEYVPLKHSKSVSNIRAVTKELQLTETNVVKSVHDPCLRASQYNSGGTTPVVRVAEDVEIRNQRSQENKVENTPVAQRTSAGTDVKLLSQDKPKPIIRVRRKSAVRLGDSEVKIVSIK